jgi:manganese/zinc/iron transport system substrate-binding protein
MPRLLAGTMPRIQALAALGLLASLLTGCTPDGEVAGSSSGAAKEPKLVRVVCTTGMVADLVEHVGGAHVEVRALMGEGVDPHLYKPSTGDIARLDGADIVFFSGLHLEGKMGDIFGSMRKHKPMIAVTDTIAHDKLLESSGGQHDPHVWFDVALWSSTLAGVADALAKHDLPHAADYRAAAERYAGELHALDDECRKSMAKLPESRRVLVTAHDAFHYFGRAYGVEVRAIQGISTESEAGVREINELVGFLVERKIKAVFVESTVNPRNVEALVEGCAARGHKLVVGGELFSDAMGRPGTPEGTYPGMVRHNVETIFRALD